MSIYLYHTQFWHFELRFGWVFFSLFNSLYLGSFSLPKVNTNNLVRKIPKPNPQKDKPLYLLNGPNKVVYVCGAMHWVQ